ncbi:Uncharacterized protein M6B38_230300 [Iris pallida]|uniref:Uncharacterized protein n=1 Tax=Iris pallida TaxID=29817 RepID=A0AAX6DSC9_IRIPA|nr:Uncharacterized protein M6B38_230300 [Iris pallida]
MASKTVESHRAGAEVCHGDAECRKKSVELLGELGLPRNLFPVVDIQEFGYNRTTGFMWLVQKKSTTYTFEKIKRKVSYATEVSAFVGPRSIKKLSGVKTRELLLWLTVSEMFFADATTKELTFKTPTGISDSCEASVFDLE